MSKTPRLPSIQLHSELEGVWLLNTPTPSTCDITHVITYTRPSSRLFYSVRGREEGLGTRLKAMWMPVDANLSYGRNLV